MLPNTLNVPLPKGTKHDKELAEYARFCVSMHFDVGDYELTDTHLQVEFREDVVDDVKIGIVLNLGASLYMESKRLSQP